ncbi:hypothetical protein P3H15_50030 [Rhodococcus sp. T2V]|uniref:hypothetical protein n=1 Tax=Rhodococcus sp. T2V TaxID=3034164 RepID=UPI0023E19D8E|nr:hypothetical protein [Rhodococcus sp. T2V]MDF3313063.1 hypothetical protein [Rhodococcus sp. T2V]
MGLFTDDKGRPELVVHPDIKLGRATFRPVDESEPVEQTPRQRARREQLRRVTEQRLAKQKTGDTDPEKG